MAVASFWSVAFGQQPQPTPTTNSLRSDVANSDVIAIVTVDTPVRVPAKSATGAAISLRATEAKLERAIKGNPPATFQIRESEKPDAIFPNVANVTHTNAGGMVFHPGHSRWLVLLKKSGDSYEPVAARGILAISGSGRGSRVDLDMVCYSLEEAEEAIKKILAHK